MLGSGQESGATRDAFHDLFIGNVAKIIAYLQHREKKQNKMETSGMSETELLRMQEEMFSKAREKYNAPVEDEKSG